MRMTPTAQIEIIKTNALENRIGLLPVMMLDGDPIRTRNDRKRSYLERSKNRKRSLRCACRPARGIAHRGEGMPVEGSGAMLAKGFKMVGSAVAFVSGEAILRINGVPFLHAQVAMRFREDGGCGDGYAAGI